MLEEHYVYQITFENGKIYIGFRTTPIGITAEQDGYCGSPSKQIWWYWQRYKYTKQIIAKCSTRDEASQLEERLIAWAKQLVGDRCINIRSAYLPATVSASSYRANNRRSSRTKCITLIDATGRTISNDGMTQAEFARQNGLCNRALSKMLKGETKSHKGWRMLWQPICKPDNLSII